MTLVILGTQDKTFERLLKQIEKEIDNGNLDDVIVQAGNTKYESKKMQIFDFISMDKFNEFLKKADLVITHGGLATIINALKENKKVIAVPRLSKYHEHEKDHQIQIVEEFSRLGYIIGCNNLKKIADDIKKVKTFKPKKYVSNNDKMINLIEGFIDNN